MACTSLVALPRECSEGVIAGIEKVYMIAYKDLNNLDGTDYVYSASSVTGNIINLGLTGGTSYVQIGLLKSTSGVEEKLTKDPAKGTCFFTQTFKLVLGDLTPANQTFVQSVVNQPVSVIYKTRTGIYFAIGLNGQFEVKTISSGTGVGESDMIGYEITFEGISAGNAQVLDPALVATLID